MRHRTATPSPSRPRSSRSCPRSTGCSDGRRAFTREQFAPIALVSADPSMIFVNASQPWKTFRRVDRRCQTRPGQIVYASGGLYGTTHLAIEIMLKATGTRMRHLPTAGGGPSLTAVLGNHAALLAAHPAVGGPQVRAGVLRPLGTMGAKRVAAFPDVPTLRELGYDAQYYQWNGIFTQAKVAEPIITFWRDAIAKAVSDPEFIQAMGRVGSGIDYLDRDRIPPLVGRRQPQDRGRRARDRQGAVMHSKDLGLAVIGAGRIGDAARAARRRASRGALHRGVGPGSGARRASSPKQVGAQVHSAATTTRGDRAAGGQRRHRLHQRGRAPRADPHRDRARQAGAGGEADRAHPRRCRPGAARDRESAAPTCASATAGATRSAT